jgi:hypothetical protein
VCPMCGLVVVPVGWDVVMYRGGGGKWRCMLWPSGDPTKGQAKCWLGPEKASPAESSSKSVANNYTS